MRSKFKWIFTLLLAFSMQFSFAQEKTITGVITENGLPLPGVSVAVKGGSKVSVADLDGKYSITASQGQSLVFTFIGYTTKTIVVGASNTVNVVMEDSATVLDIVEIVNTGYDRTRTKASTSSAVTTISSETLENRPNASFLNSLQGTAPGLTILSSSGSPGSAKIDTFIRGVSSLNAATDPLIVIDGVPTNGNQFRNLNQNDIETVNVLKDAAATSIYGNRGANGVLVITTKRAAYGSALKISYDVTTGVSTLPGNDYNMSSTQEIKAIERSVGFGAALTPEQIAALPNTDWKKVFFGSEVMQQHNLGISFGGENASNYTSLGYFEQGGMVPTTDFKRFTLRNNLNGKSSNGRFTYASQLAVGFSRRNQLNQEANAGVNNNTIQNPLHGSIMGLPYVLPGQYASGIALYQGLGPGYPAGIGTTFAGPNDTYVLEDILREGSMPNWYDETSILANISASFKINDYFTLSNKSGVDFKQTDRVYARDPGSYLALAVQLTSPTTIQFGGFENRSTNKDFTFTNISSLSYSKAVGDHKIDAGVYLEYMKAHYSANGFTQNGLNPKTYVPGAGTGYAPYIPGYYNTVTGTNVPAQNVPSVSALKYNAGTLSYFANVDYDYKDKYGLTGVVRRDGTYRFGDENKWGTFWSVSGRWNIDQEDFMEGSTFSLLKLRASYGTQGNQNVLATAYGANPIFAAANLVRDLNVVGSGYNNDSGIFIQNLAYPSLQWEEISQLNIGLDFRILNNKLEGNLDVYRKQTEKLYNTISRSAITGIYDQNGNNGALRNSGVELLLKYHIFNDQDFKLSVFANASYNKNEILSIGDSDQSGNSLVFLPGGKAGAWNLIPYIGVNQSNGNLLFMDKNGNPTENPDLIADRRVSDKSSIPAYQGGFGFNADYKGFYMDVLFTWTQDVWRYDNQLRWAYDPTSIGDDNLSADLLNAWTPGNHTNFPSLTASNLTQDTESDRYLFDSSFLRLKNTSIGYNVPSRFLEKTFISSLKFFVQGENLLTWTKWRGFDPESTSAFYVTGYPNPRTLSFGTSVRF